VFGIATGSACYIREDWECMLYQGGLGVHAISWRTGSACYIMGDLECRDRSAAMI